MQEDVKDEQIFNDINEDIFDHETFDNVDNDHDDFDDKITLSHTFSGCDTVFVVTNFWEHMDPKREFQQAKTMTRDQKCIEPKCNYTAKNYTLFWTELLLTQHRIVLKLNSILHLISSHQIIYLLINRLIFAE